ncbi:MAG: ABC transporter ATP-binding protein [Eubacterium sp.]|nr:ABC transporter ATP-binding protein/permease [Eubacterium sp.]MDD5994151.1 ABC transporter ATP-binding protein [Clostridiales bacterium]MDY3773513.1 ABC transporter ATP-binding protein [Eubacterium sp.]
MEETKNYFQWKEFLSYYKPFRGIFAADMFFAFLGALTTLVIPLMVRYITGTVVYLPKEQMLSEIFLLGAGMVVLVAIQCYSNYFIGNYGHVMGAKIEYNMRKEIFEHYQKLSFSFYDNQKVGQLMSRITNDLFDITELLHHGPEDVVISFIKFVGTLGILTWINWRLALAAFVLIPIMFVYAYFLNKKMKRAFKNNREKVADINTRIEDNLSGIRVVKSFANEAMEREKFMEGNQGFLDSKKNSYFYMGQYHAGLTAFITMITVVVILTGAVLLAGGTIQAPDLITFLLYISNFTEPVQKLINFTEQFQNGITGYERFREILAIEPEIKECENPVEAKSIKGEVVFDDVGFRYEEDQEKVLSHVSLRVNAGEYVALVGTSGAGKTTLCSLIPRFYEVTFGSIYLDGVDVRQYTLSSLRKSIGVVQQEVYLFAGTVMENIRYGKVDATREEVIQAAKDANAHEFIMALPEGYDTNIGQRGVKLSGGQKQRLSIARVFLKNPPVLIFDEATSALDNESEKVVQESLEKLAKNRTTFVIAHRLSTIKNAQRILVLTEEGICEEGSHEELMKKRGVYYNLYTLSGNPL